MTILQRTNKFRSLDLICPNTFFYLKCRVRQIARSSSKKRCSFATMKGKIKQVSTILPLVSESHCKSSPLHINTQNCCSHKFFCYKNERFVFYQKGNNSFLLISLLSRIFSILSLSPCRDLVSFCLFLPLLTTREMEILKRKQLFSCYLHELTCFSLKCCPNVETTKE